MLLLLPHTLLLAQAAPRPGVPAAGDHWGYTLVEMLEATGVVPPGTSAARPLPLESLRTVLQDASRNPAADPALREWIEAALLRFEEEFPLPSGITARGRATAGFRAVGGTLANGSGALAELALRVEQAPAGAFAFVEHAAGNGTERPRFRRGGAGIGTSKLWFYAGREAFQLGGGEGGGIVLNDHVPLDGLLLGSPSPARLPGLGLARAHFGIFRLSGYRAVDDPWFATLRITLQPAGWLQLGTSRALLFGGYFKGGAAPYDPKVYPPDSTSLGFADVVRILLGRNSTRDDSKVSFEARATLAGVGVPALVYAEMAFEDLDRSFSDPAIVAGLLALIRPEIAMRYEYAAFGRGARICSWCDTLPAYWYYHRRFQSGYQVDRGPLGHPLGGYGSQHLVQARYVRPQTRLRVDVTGTVLERRWLNLLEAERPGRAVGAAVKAAYRPWTWVELELSAATERGRARWRRTDLILLASAFF
ncbi:MAG: hypothetical protein HY701_09445 [Gemmatimonadetes bacterium]|nr:hypothetical protein [Gemmatimonadota bacterium]